MIKIEYKQKQIISTNDVYWKIKQSEFQNQDNKADINQIPEKIHIGTIEETCFLRFQLIKVGEKIGIVKVEDIIGQEL